MTQTNNRFFDEIGRLMNDAAGAAQGVKREVDAMWRNQAEKILRDLDIVKREEFEAVKDMARLAREENDALKARIAALEAKLGGSAPRFARGSIGARMATTPKRDLPVMAFASPQAWDAWLSAQSVGAKGVWLKIAKKSSGVKTISRDEAVDAALCYGWIDGQLDRFDATYWLIRFTPRTSTSIWSEKNRVRAVELVEQGRMRPAGLHQIACAQKDGRWQKAYASSSKAEVPDDLAAALARNRKALVFFEKLNRQNRYAILYRTHTAKKPETRAARIEKFVAMLARGETIYPQKASTPPKAAGKAIKAPKKAAKRPSKRG